MRLTHLYFVVTLVVLYLNVNNVYCEIDFLDDELLFEQEIYQLNELLDQTSQTALFNRNELQNLTEEEWYLRISMDAERARQDAVFRKIQLLEKYRAKLSKFAEKSWLYEERARTYLNLSSNCDIACSRRCFEENKHNTVAYNFVNCLVPRCNCMNSFAVQFVPKPAYDATTLRNQTVEAIRRASDKVAEGWPVLRSVNATTGYDLIRDCDVSCQSDCLDIKKYVPFETVLQCSRYRCNCWYKLDVPIQNQIDNYHLTTDITHSALGNIQCNRECAVQCVNVFTTQAQVYDCVQHKCGCYPIQRQDGSLVIGDIQSAGQGGMNRGLQQGTYGHQNLIDTSALESVNIEQLILTDIQNNLPLINLANKEQKEKKGEEGKKGKSKKGKKEQEEEVLGAEEEEVQIKEEKLIKREKINQQEPSYQIIRVDNLTYVDGGERRQEQPWYHAYPHGQLNQPPIQREERYNVRYQDQQGIQHQQDYSREYQQYGYGQQQHQAQYQHYPHSSQYQQDRYAAGQQGIHQNNYYNQNQADIDRYLNEQYQMNHPSLQQSGQNMQPIDQIIIREVTEEDLRSNLYPGGSHRQPVYREEVIPIIRHSRDNAFVFNEQNEAAQQLEASAFIQEPIPTIESQLQGSWLNALYGALSVVMIFGIIFYAYYYFYQREDDYTAQKRRIGQSIHKKNNENSYFKVEDSEAAYQKLV